MHSLFYLWEKKWQQNRHCSAAVESNISPIFSHKQQHRPAEKVYTVYMVLYVVYINFVEYAVKGKYMTRDQTRPRAHSKNRFNFSIFVDKIHDTTSSLQPTRIPNIPFLLFLFLTIFFFQHKHYTPSFFLSDVRISPHWNSRVGTSHLLKHHNHPLDIFSTFSFITYHIIHLKKYSWAKSLGW